MKWLLCTALLVSLTHSVLAVEAGKKSIQLECKEKRPGNIPDWVPGLKQYADKALTLTLTRTAVVIEADDLKKTTGEAFGTLPTEKFSVKEFGKEGLLVLGSAGAYLGAQTAVVYLRAKGYKDEHAEATHSADTHSVELRCKNSDPGAVAGFIHLCTKEPKFAETTCKIRKDSFNEMPKTISFQSGGKGIEVSYVDDAKNAVSLDMTFFRNSEPAINSTVKLLEYCYFAVMGKSTDQFSSLRISRGLAEKGNGLASVKRSGSDGADVTLYDCAK